MKHTVQQISISREPKNLEGLLYKFYRLRNPGNLALRTYFWTAVSGTAFCATSFVLLAAIVRLLGDEGPYWGGVFSIVLALSKQLITVGLFQMRPFQVSDLDEVFTFSDYFFSRILTTALMFVMGFAWMIFGGMGHDKIIALLLLLVVRAGESISDVIEGRYQQAGRFDIASKGVFFKTLLPLIIFIIALWAWRNMFTALAAMAIAHSLLLAATDGILIRSFANISLASRITDKPQPVSSLLRAFRTAGLRRGLDYLHLSRVGSRVLSRLKAKIHS
jgi:hypothetical protein